MVVDVGNVELDCPCACSTNTAEPHIAIYAGTPKEKLYCSFAFSAMS
jgi:hypothetical protein